MARTTREPRTEIEPARPADSWKARPVLAWLIRATLVVVPLAMSWIAVRFAIRFVPAPANLARTIVWVAGALALSTLVHQLIRRMLRRFSSLGVLYTLSLSFPDTPPSRLRSGLRSRRVEELERDLGAEATGTLEPRMKAKRMAELVTMVSRREFVNRGHSDRVRSYAEGIGKELGLDEAELHRLRWATLLHDVGMLDVPTRVLDRRGPLDEYDRAAIEQHPVHAIGYLAPFADWLGPWGTAATEHHERWDGGGYPAGLASEEISLAGRIVAVADAYDAMTASRSYRKPITPAAARQELVDNAGTQFDPAIVRAFLDVGIRRSRAALGPLGALVQLPANLASVTSGVVGGASVAAFSAATVVASAVALPAISSDVVLSPAAVERVVDNTTTTTAPPTTTTEPTTTTTTRPLRRTTTTTTPLTTTTTTTTTTAAPAPIPTTTTRAPTTTTVAPTTTPPPTTTTTVAPPTYPTVPTTTVTPYPTTGP
jgi:HD-GYP domain-containing protein (c-di-GMP phosphodiesterase class II)